ncbi:MAG: alpha/beta fold hydrolase [Gammaproteobacteria bacterium]|nr:alpha/beta fold hydrolase [Gammaproteobacteria bacterium]
MLLPTSALFNGNRLQLEKGGELEALEVAFETYGTLSEAGDNGVLVCHGYTNNQHAAGDANGWFSGLIGPGKAVDTNCFFVVAPNMLGSAYGSTGPASTNPATGKPYGLDFPDITVGDMVNAQIRLLVHLGVKQLAAVIGNSFGGHLACHWGTVHPDRMRALVVVASAVQGRGDQGTVDKLTDRFSQCSGWNGGQYYGREKEAGIFDEMRKIRVETLKQYGFEHKIREEVGDQPDVVAQRLAELATPWAEQFDANSLIVLRKAAVQFDARPRLANIKAPLLYVLSRSDNLFPPSIAPGTMSLLKGAGVDARFFELDSDNGHRAPSLDWQGWAEQLETFLNGRTF